LIHLFCIKNILTWGNL